MFPHGGDGQRYLLVPLVGVVEDVHIQRVLRPVARLGEQRLGLFDPRLLAHQLAGRALELEAIDARRGQAEGRELPLSQDLLRDGVPVDGKGERLAHPDVVEGFALGVEHVVVGGEHGGAHQIVRALALDLLILLQGIGGVVQFARAIAVVGRGIGDDLQIDHLVQHCVLIVPVVGIALGDEPLVGGPLLEGEGAVGDYVARFDPLVTELLYGGPGGREGGVVGEGLEEEGDRGLEGYLQGVIIEGLDAQGIRALLALHHLAGVGDAGQLDEPGVVGGVFGIRRPLPAIDIIRRRHRLAVGPLGIGSELEGVDGAGVIELVPERSRRLQLAVAIQGVEPLEQIVDDVAARTLFHHLGVDGGGFCAYVAHEGLLGTG
ncbi:hypothetical protein D3C71_1328910 [compost metagenome]